MKRARTLTRDRVLRTALALADDQGLEALTMRALGDALGVQAMSLYNHVANKDAILDGIVDLVVSEMEVPSAADPWKDAMRKRCSSAHAVLLRHPWACGQLARANTGPAMIRYVDATLGCLHGAGFSLEEADRAWNALDSHVFGFTLQKLNFPFKADEYAAVAAGYLPFLSKDQFPTMYLLTERVATGAYNGLHDVEFGLDLLLDGLERRLGSASHPPGRAAKRSPF